MGAPRPHPVAAGGWSRLLKPAVFALLSLPLIWIVWAVVAEASAPGSVLGADPGKEVVDHLGEWSLRALLLALSVSTVRRRARWPAVGATRRMIGLFAFVYVVLHALAYVGLLAGFDTDQLVDDLTERRYIIVGAVALAALVPLAVTSTNGLRRRMGPRWRALHRLVYPIAALALLHVWWLTKADYGEWLVYVIWFGMLMVERWLARSRAPVRPPRRNV